MKFFCKCTQSLPNQPPSIAQATHDERNTIQNLMENFSLSRILFGFWWVQQNLASVAEWENNFEVVCPETKEDFLSTFFSKCFHDTESVWGTDSKLRVWKLESFYNSSDEWMPILVKPELLYSKKDLNCSLLLVVWGNIKTLRELFSHLRGVSDAP